MSKMFWRPKIVQIVVITHHTEKNRSLHAEASPRTFDLGDESCPEGGGRNQVSQNHLPLNSDFSSDFAYFVLEILENLSFSKYCENFI